MIFMIMRYRSAIAPQSRSRVSEETASLVFSPTSDDAGKRLDAYLAGKIDGWSRSRLQRLIENEDVLVNESGPSNLRTKFVKVMMIEVDLIEVPVARFEPENIPLDIVFEDEFLAVINKPAGMVVHPGAGVQSGTLANAIAHHFELEQSSAGGPQSEARIGIVHRLDKDTSGLIVVAKTDEIHEALSEQFRERDGL